MSIRIGVLCPSEIALRRFMPAVKKNAAFEYVGVAYANAAEWFGNQNVNADIAITQEKAKAKLFQDNYGGEIFDSYDLLLDSDQVDAIYIPLPPILHYNWVKRALLSGKHVLVEKPSTTLLSHTEELVQLAIRNNLALHENYMFMFHPQLEFILDQIQSGTLGEIRLYRIAFGFPFRGEQDFRYNPAMGGGATLDCGGYTVKLASRLLGEDGLSICDKHLHYSDQLGVDIFADATMRNKAGTTAQISFGMDNSYKCQLEVWGSKGSLSADRIFTAPPDVSPEISISCMGESSTKKISATDQFHLSLTHFFQCIQNHDVRMQTHQGVLMQSKLMDDLLRREGESE